MNVTLISVPYQLDVGRWCYALGPQAFIEAGIAGELEQCGHEMKKSVTVEMPRSERTRDTVTNLAAIARRTSAAVAESLKEKDGFALVLEGDCTHAVGAIGGMARAAGTPGVIWFDAHADLHTMKTTSSGYIGGMPYAVALGWEFDDWRTAAGLDPAVSVAAAALVGASDVDPEEEEAMRRTRFARLDAAAMDSGSGAKLTDLLRPKQTAAESWYLHLDVDVAGPEVVPGGMTPTDSPPSVDALLTAFAAVPKLLPVRALGIATYNPSGDSERRGVKFAFAMLRAALAQIHR